MLYRVLKAFELWIPWYEPLSSYFALLSSSRASQRYIRAYSDWYTVFEELSQLFYLKKYTENVSFINIFITFAKYLQIYFN